MESLALISGKVEEEILIRNEYLAAENEILKSKLKGRIVFKDTDRIRLAKIGKRMGMKALKEECASEGFPFTVDSDIHPQGKPFDMGAAAGHFAYVEDPDGTLIEFVETHRIPISKRLGWYINLWDRKDVTKPLSHLLMQMIRFMKVKPHKLT